eukprot:4169759-Prymnesium_polylepis.1
MFAPRTALTCRVRAARALRWSPAADVRPLGQQQWYEFDDTRVSPVSEDAAVRGQYGGGHGRGTGLFGMGAAPNAYMLCYVRQDDAANAPEPDASELPAGVRAAFEADLKRNVRRRTRR